MASAILTFLTVFLLLPLLLESHRIYYVKPHGSTNTSCPPDALSDNTCHTLSYYTSQTDTYFVSNATFIFMEGNHLLDRKVSIVYANNLTLKGQGQWVEGNTKNVMQSTVIITCNGKVGGFSFSLSKDIKILGITVTDCNGQDGSVLYINSHNLTMTMTSIQNSSGFGMIIENVWTLNLDTCSFTNNGHKRGGNLAILAFGTNILWTIKNINSTLGFGEFGSGLNILITLSIYVSVQMENIIVEENIALFSGANIYIEIKNSSIANINANRIYSIKGNVISRKYSHFSTGGGLQVSLVNLKCASFTQICVTDSIIQGNYANARSGMSILFNNVHNCKVTIANSTFSSNGYNVYHGNQKAVPISLSGGGIGTDSINYSQENEIVITNCFFQNNTAFEGGALAMPCQNKLAIENTTFEGNSGFLGAAFSIRSDFVSVQCQVQITNVLVKRNTRVNALIIAFWFSGFSYNSSMFYTNSAIVFSAQEQFTIQITDILVRDNYNVSGLVVQGCNINFSGNNNAFINNSSPLIGGGMVLFTRNYFEVNEGSHVLFTNNTAGLYGGAIYAKEMGLNDIDYSDLNIILFGRFAPCSFRTNQLRGDDKVLMTFKNNQAHRAGKDVYGGTYQLCEIAHNDYIVPVPNELQSCLIAKYWSMEKNRTISSSPIAVCPCINGRVKCEIRTLYREVYPGQSFLVSLVTVGTCQGISPGTIVVDTNGGNLTTNTEDQLTSTKCKNFIYSIKQTTTASNATVFINTARTKISLAHHLTVDVQFLPCPIGLKLSNTSGLCICNDRIEKTIPNDEISCYVNNSQNVVNRTGNNWIAYFKDYNCTVAHTNCPFDYCNPSLVSFNITSPNPQCAFNRAGTLCGQCKSGLSLMLGSNKCTDCTNSYLALLLPFAVAGIVLIALLITVNLTVSSGRINGLLFYANIVKLNETAFFPNGGVPVLRQFISWLNLDLGIETCFYNGLDGYWKTWLQFAFPLYLWLLALVVIISCHYSLRLSRVCGRNAVPVLATLFLMSYTKLLRNITNVFMFTTLSCNNNRWFIWSVDATLDYSSNPRLPLLIFSSILLFIGIVYTLLVFSSQWLQRYSYICCHKASRDPVFRLKPLIDAYCGPYKDSSRFWTGLLLIVRLVLTGLFSYTSSMNYQVNNIIVLGIVLLLASLAWIVGGMYKTRELNTIEILSYLNIGFVTLSSIMTNGQYSQVIISGISTGVALFVLIVLALSPLFESKIKLYREKRKHVDECEMPLLGNDASSSSECSHPGSPAVILMRRESLIFDFIPEDLKSVNEKYLK